MWSVWFVFCDWSFQSACPLTDKDKSLTETSWWERQKGKLDPVQMGRAMISKSSIQFSVDGWGSVPSLLFDLRPNYGGGNEDTWSFALIATLSDPTPTAGCWKPMPLLETLGHTGKSGSVSCGVTAPFSWVLVYTRFCLCPLRVCFPSPV